MKAWASSGKIKGYDFTWAGVDRTLKKTYNTTLSLEWENILGLPRRSIQKPLTYEQIKKSLALFFRRHKQYPTGEDVRAVPLGIATNWHSLDNAMRTGKRGLKKLSLSLVIKNIKEHYDQ